MLLTFLLHVAAITAFGLIVHASNSSGFSSKLTDQLLPIVSIFGISESDFALFSPIFFLGPPVFVLGAFFCCQELRQDYGWRPFFFSFVVSLGAVCAIAGISWWTQRGSPVVSLADFPGTNAQQNFRVNVEDSVGAFFLLGLLHIGGLTISQRLSLSKERERDRKRLQLWLLQHTNAQISQPMSSEMVAMIMVMLSGVADERIHSTRIWLISNGTLFYGALTLFQLVSKAP